MKLVYPKGTTSRIVTVFIQDSSVSTGAGLGSLDQTSSIVGGFVREGETGVALAVDENVTTEGTYQAPSAVGKVRIGTPANMRTGTYELHFHNDLYATGAEAVAITLGGASNMVELPIEIQLSDPVRGLGAPTALAGSAAGAAGGFPVSTAGSLEMDTLADWLNGGRLDLLLDAVATSAELVSEINDVQTDIAALNDPTATAIADELLKRDWTSVSGEAARSVLNALRVLRNKVDVPNGQVKKEDDSTNAWTFNTTTDAAADPITVVTPT